MSVVLRAPAGQHLTDPTVRAEWDDDWRLPGGGRCDTQFPEVDENGVAPLAGKTRRGIAEVLVSTSATVVFAAVHGYPAGVPAQRVHPVRRGDWQPNDPAAEDGHHQP